MLIEHFEVHVLRFQRFDNQALGLREERRQRTDARQLGVGRQLGDDRQRKVPSDTIDAWDHQPDNRRRPARAALSGETPDRTREVHIQPAIPECLTACGHAVLQPGVPRADKRIGRAPAQKIAVARQLAVQAYVHGALPVGRLHSFISRYRETSVRTRKLAPVVVAERVADNACCLDDNPRAMSRHLEGKRRTGVVLSLLLRGGIEQAEPRPGSREWHPRLSAETLVPGNRRGRWIHSRPDCRQRYGWRLVLGLVAVDIKYEPDRRRVDFGNGQKELQFQFAGSLEKDFANPLRPFELIENRARRLRDGPRFPRPRRLRSIDERLEILSEELVISGVVAEEVGEVPQRNVRTRRLRKWIAAGDDLGAIPLNLALIARLDLGGRSRHDGAFRLVPDLPRQ